MIACGWCARLTADRDRCASCGHADPATPWLQRGMEPPEAPEHDAGRPPLDPADVRRRLADARASLPPNPTVEQLADRLDVSPRTVRRWQKVAG